MPRKKKPKTKHEYRETMLEHLYETKIQAISLIRDIRATSDLDVESGLQDVTDLVSQQMRVIIESSLLMNDIISSDDFRDGVRSVKRSSTSTPQLISGGKHMIGHYVYIIRFKDKKHFKVGVSSGNFNRLNHHNKQFRIIPNDILLINCEDRTTAYLIEKIILHPFPPLEENIFEGRDGYTEIRSNDYYNDALDIAHKMENIYDTEIEYLDEELILEEPILITSNE